MPNRITSKLHFGRLGRRVIEVGFTGDDLSSDGGLMLLRRVDSKIGLSAAVAKALGDARDVDRITHPLRHLIAQRLYGICCGYEDLNGHDALHHQGAHRVSINWGSRPSWKQVATRSVSSRVWSTAPSSSAPASELICPPSKSTSARRP